jgi:hypothetical protein
MSARITLSRIRNRRLGMPKRHPEYRRKSDRWLFKHLHLKPRQYERRWEIAASYTRTKVRGLRRAVPLKVTINFEKASDRRIAFFVLAYVDKIKIFETRDYTTKDAKKSAKEAVYLVNEIIRAWNKEDEAKLFTPFHKNFEVDAYGYSERASFQQYVKDCASDEIGFY